LRHRKAPFHHLFCISSAFAEISSEFVEISSVLVEISSELVQISFELVLTSTEPLIISVFKKSTTLVYSLPVSPLKSAKTPLFFFCSLRKFVRTALNTAQAPRAIFPSVCYASESKPLSGPVQV